MGINGWISCKRKMPDSGKTVIVCNDDIGIVKIAVKSRNGLFMDENGIVSFTVTHWQELPEPPTKKSGMKVCQNCGKQFAPKAGNQKFCTPYCRESVVKTERKGRCPFCGMIFVKKNNQVFCCTEHQKAFYKSLDVKE